MKCLEEEVAEVVGEGAGEAEVMIDRVEEGGTGTADGGGEVGCVFSSYISFSV